MNKFCLTTKCLTCLFIFCGIVTACSNDEDLVSNSSQKQSNISYSVTTWSDGLSKGVLSKGAQVSEVSSYGVCVAAYNKNLSYDDIPWGSYIYNMSLSDSNGNTEYPWPTDDYKISSVAWSPYSNDYVTIGEAATTRADGNFISYKTPEDAIDHVDLVAACQIGTDCPQEEAVPLVFHHLLSNLKFSVRNYLSTALTVKSLTVTGFMNSASFIPDANGNFSETGIKNASLNGADDPQLSCDINIASTGISEITAGNGQFFLVPSKLTVGTRMLDLCVEINGDEYHYYYDIDSTKQFEMGHTYSYILTIHADMEVSTASSITDWGSAGLDVQFIDYITGSITDWTVSEDNNLDRGENGGITDWTIQQ